MYLTKYLRDYFWEVARFNTEEIEVTFYSKTKPVKYRMEEFGMLLADSDVKEIMSLLTGEMLFIREGE